MLPLANCNTSGTPAFLHSWQNPTGEATRKGSLIIFVSRFLTLLFFLHNCGVRLAVGGWSRDCVKTTLQNVSLCTTWLRMHHVLLAWHPWSRSGHIWGQTASSHGPNLTRGICGWCEPIWGCDPQFGNCWENASPGIFFDIVPRKYLGPPVSIFVTSQFKNKLFLNIYGISASNRTF